MTRLVTVLSVLAGLIGLALWWIVLPGKPSAGPAAVPESGLAQRLMGHVRALAEIGPRHAGRPDTLERALFTIEAGFRDAGVDAVRRPYAAGDRSFANVEVVLRGAARPEEQVVVGAHYDSVPSSAGADDNASGVAALIELARRLKSAPLGRSVRLVAFANEELPLGDLTPAMGSLRYAAQLR